MSTIKKIPSKDTNSILSTKTIFLPLHCIKELIENSLDAKATSITIQADARSCGLNFLSVSDNGCGILKKERDSIALPNHTLKIFDYEDLQSDIFNQLGFRGEALFCLRELTQKGSMTVCSKAKHDMFAEEWSISREGKRNIINDKLVIATTGTKISLTRLFYHLPVRYRVLCNDAVSNISDLKKLLLSFSFNYSDTRFYFKPVDCNQNLMKIVSHNPNKDLVFYSKDLIVQGLTNLFTSVKKIKDKIFEGSKSFDMAELDCSISISICLKRLTKEPSDIDNCKPMKSLSVNKRIMLNVLVNSFFHKVNKLLNNLYHDHEGSPGSVWFIKLDSISNKLIDINVEPQKNDVRFIGKETESVILKYLEKFINQELERQKFELDKTVEVTYLESVLSNYDKDALSKAIDSVTETTITTQCLSESDKAYVADDQTLILHPLPEDHIETPESSEQEEDEEKEKEADWCFAMYDESYLSLQVQKLPSSSISENQVSNISDEDLKILNKDSISNPFTIARMRGSKNLGLIKCANISQKFIASSTPKKLEQSSPDLKIDHVFDSVMGTAQTVKRITDKARQMHTRLNQNRDENQFTIDQLMRNRNALTSKKEQVHSCELTLDIKRSNDIPRLLPDFYWHNDIRWLHRKGFPSNNISDGLRGLLGAKQDVTWSREPEEWYSCT